MGVVDDMESRDRHEDILVDECERLRNEICDKDSRIHELTRELKEAKLQIERAYLENIETLRYAVEVRNPYTRGHSERVSKYAVLIGGKMGLTESELKTLRIGGLFHDIGKIGTPDSILLKEGKLTDEEYARIKRHPLIGTEILSNARVFDDILPVVKYHHERFDGSGYPEQLKGDEIPLLARITAVADSFDAMSSRRTYRDKLEMEVIVQEIKNGKGTQFDPEIADVFIDVLENCFEEIGEIQKSYV